MHPSAPGDPPVRPADAPAAVRVDLEIPLHLITERVTLSALREQDAADAADAARRRAEFLSDASLRFGTSLDQEITYAAISGLALPGLGAWCIVDVVEVGGGLRRLAVIHPDEDKHAMARALAGRWIPSADDLIGVPAVRRDRVPVIIRHHAAADVVTVAGDADTQRALQWLGAGSLLVVPVVAHHVLLGAITFVGRPDAPEYSPEAIALGQALAERCAQALESARLYAAARAAWAEAEIARADAEAARTEAESANAAKANFLSTMSHELRTPLNAIGGYAQLMEMGVRGPITPEQQTDLASIQRSQAHLLGLVDSVLNYGQLAAGRVVYSTDNIPLVEVVASVRSFVAPQMLAKGLEYIFETCEAPLVVRADAAKLRQIVVNLLGNATKFTPSGGRISVTCSDAAPSPNDGDAEASAMLTVRVTDTGVGIAADQIEAVFDPFVQVNRRLTSPDGGVGLGLAISRDLARGMGGDLTVESALGSGSTFILTLPKA